MEGAGTALPTSGIGEGNKLDLNNIFSFLQSPPQRQPLTRFGLNREASVEHDLLFAC